MISPRRLARYIPLLVLACSPWLLGCDEETDNPDSTQSSMEYWEEQATAHALRRADWDLKCKDLATQTVERGDAVMVKWYGIEVRGCGKKVRYDVTCAHRKCDVDRKGDVLAEGGGPVEDAAEPEEPDAPTEEGAAVEEIERVEL